MNRSTFYNEKDFLIDSKLAKEYARQDSGIFIHLFQMNIVLSEEDVYGESLPNEKIFLDPVKLNIYPNIEGSVTQKLGDGTLTDETIEKAVFGLFIDELIEKNLDPKRGDFILYDDNVTKRFFEINVVTNISTNHTMNNYKSFYKIVETSYIKDYLLPDNLKTII